MVLRMANDNLSKEQLLAKATVVLYRFLRQDSAPEKLMADLSPVLDPPKMRPRQ